MLKTLRSDTLNTCGTQTVEPVKTLNKGFKKQLFYYVYFKQRGMFRKMENREHKHQQLYKVRKHIAFKRTCIGIVLCPKTVNPRYLKEQSDCKYNNIVLIISILYIHYIHSHFILTQFQLRHATQSEYTVCM